MSGRLEKAIEKLIYWRNAYVHCRKRCVESNDSRYSDILGSNYIQLLSCSEWLKTVYEEESGKKITKVGNLPEVEVLTEEAFRSHSLIYEIDEDNLDYSI